MSIAEVRIIPFSGQALEFESPDAARMLLPAPERGFLIGPENYVLEQAVRWAVDGDPPDGVQPITFFGPSGFGKSHLLQGIVDAWEKTHGTRARKKRAFYLTSADFARHFTEAIDTKTTDDFRRRYRNAALLIVDELDGVSEKPHVQEELLHTLDAVVAAQGTVIFATLRFPGEPDFLWDRFAARLVGGLTLPIAPPGPAVRLRFLRELASAFRVSLPPTALEFIASELRTSLPLIFGTFSQMYFEAKVDDVKLDTRRIKAFLKKRIVETRPGIAEIAKKTAKYFSLKLVDLRGKSRTKTIAQARSVAVYLAREKTGLSLKEIGEYFGGRDHTTIRHLVESVESGIAADPTLRDHVLRLR